MEFCAEIWLERWAEDETPLHLRTCSVALCKRGLPKVEIPPSHWSLGLYDSSSFVCALQPPALTEPKAGGIIRNATYAPSPAGSGQDILIQKYSSSQRLEPPGGSENHPGSV